MDGWMILWFCFGSASFDLPNFGFWQQLANWGVVTSVNLSLLKVNSLNLWASGTNRPACCLCLVAGVKSVHWPSSPSQTCRFILKHTQRRRPTSVLTAPRPLWMRPTWPSTWEYTWASNRTAAPTVRGVSDSCLICSSIPGQDSQPFLFVRQCWKARMFV